MMLVAENALVLVSWMVVTVGLAGMLSLMLAGLNERRREMAILRSVGARPAYILLLVSGESILLILTGVALGLTLTYSVDLAATADDGGEPFRHSAGHRPAECP
jgi:putative ABC transport system permease protein